MEGWYLEDFEVGKTYRSAARTVTEADVVNFAGLSGDFNPLHMDDEFAERGPFGGRIAHGALGCNGVYDSFSLGPKVTCPAELPFNVKFWVLFPRSVGSK